MVMLRRVTNPFGKEFEDTLAKAKALKKPDRPKTVECDSGFRDALDSVPCGKIFGVRDFALNHVVRLNRNYSVYGAELSIMPTSVNVWPPNNVMCTGCTVFMIKPMSRLRIPRALVLKPNTQYKWYKQVITWVGDLLYKPVL